MTTADRPSRSPGASRLRPYLAYLAWAQALVAMAGSLYFSEVMKMAPCVLCWYQRILMYPLVIILAVGILTLDRRRLRLYVLPFSILGLVVATYHNLLYFGFVDEGLTSCSIGVSCSTQYFDFLGFIDIPQMSLTAFAVITVAMVLYRPWGTGSQA